MNELDSSEAAADTRRIRIRGTKQDHATRENKFNNFPSLRELGSLLFAWKQAKQPTTTFESCACC